MAMGWTSDHVKAYNRKRGIEAGPERLPAPEQKPCQETPLDGPCSGEDQDCPPFKIVFRIHATRPNDWDNPWTKICQDLLIAAGILHDDKWNVLSGQIIPRKAKTISEEKTEITIYKLE